MTHVQPSTATHDKHGFPLQECPRCGGSGRHSYCERFGTTCFQCGGQGRARTRAADREYRKWGEAVIAAQTTRVTDVKVGEMMWHAIGMGGAHRWFKVTDIKYDIVCVWDEFGQPRPTVTFTLARRGNTVTSTYCEEMTVRINRGDAQPKPDEYVARAIAKEESKK